MEVTGPFGGPGWRDGLLLLARAGNVIYGFPFSAPA